MVAPKPIDEERLRQLVGEGWTDGRIGEELGVSSSAVRRARNRLGLEAQATGRPSKGLTAAFLFRMTDEQLRQLHARADAEGLSTQDYLTRLTFGN